MSMSEHGKCKQAIAEIRETIPDRLRELDEQFMEVLDTRGKCDSSALYAEAMTDLVFNVVEHAIFSHTDKTEGLEAFRDRLQGAIQTLDIALSVLGRSESESEYTSVDWHRQFDEMMMDRHH